MDGLDLEAFQRALHQLADNADINVETRHAIDHLRQSLPGLAEATRDASPTGDDGSSALMDTIDSSVKASGSFKRIPTKEHTPPQLANPFRDRPDHRPPTTNPAAVDDAKLDRFVNLGLVGRGGMGEVYRVLDPHLKRRMVLKVIRRDQCNEETAVSRFLEEARITAQLQHPGIVPVHELGVLEDGRLYFTMREVRGRTFKEVIHEAHDAFETCNRDEKNWHAQFRGLIDVFFRVCEPIAYAHAQGIIHRDIKPSNVMVGDFGEVQILDWGLAKSLSAPCAGDFDSIDLDEFEDLEDLDDPKPSFNTRRGSIIGTPTFMPPEQARGMHDALGPPADVYSLGAILFMVLDGRVPFTGTNTATILFQVIEGIDRSPGEAQGAPEALVDLCLWAMSIDADDRPQDAGAFAEAISNWRDGSNRRTKARELIETADERIPQYRSLRQRAEKLRTRSRRMLREIPPSAPIGQKRPAWSLQEEAELLEREASVHRARVIQCLDTALTHVPDFKPAHDRLAEIYRHDHAEAERQRDLRSADSLEVFIRAHNTGKFDAYLAGYGRLNLSTRPPGARVTISRYVQQDRRLICSLERLLGHTPVLNSELPMGSYALEINASGRAPVNYPVFIGRQASWSGTPSEDAEGFGVALPFFDELDDDDIYVPGSKFWRGGDARATDSPPRAITWVDPFIIKKHPVTHREYLHFLNDLVAQGRLDEADRFCPRNAGHIGYEQGKSIYVRDVDGTFRTSSDDEEFLDLPVSLIDWHSARAYARWVATATSQPWRLPTSNEWEQAARGVDGRFFPWGDSLDPTLCRMVQSTQEVPCPVPVDRYRSDVSPYGMRGAAGNIRDWCLPNNIAEIDEITDETLMPFRGGCWFSTPEMCRLAGRHFKPTITRSAGTGFRLARDY